MTVAASPAPTALITNTPYEFILLRSSLLVGHQAFPATGGNERCIFDELVFSEGISDTPGRSRRSQTRCGSGTVFLVAKTASRQARLRKLMACLLRLVKDFCGRSNHLDVFTGDYGFELVSVLAPRRRSFGGCASTFNITPTALPPRSGARAVDGNRFRN